MGTLRVLMAAAVAAASAVAALDRVQAALPGGDARFTLSAGQTPLAVIPDIEARYLAQLKTGLTVRGGDGVDYHLSLQPSRLGAPGESTAYLVLYRDGGAPVYVDVREIERSWGIIGVGGSIAEVSVDGQDFELHLKADAADRDCRKPPQSLLQVWPKGRKKGMVQLSITALFERTGKAGTTLRIPSTTNPGSSVEVAVLFYTDHPDAGDRRSIAFLIGPPLNRIQRVPFEWIPTDGGVLTAVINGRKFGVRLGGAENRDLEIFELPSEGSPEGLREVPLSSLAPPHTACD